MSYAQRPMGDYKTYGYAGDPGWLSSIWKGIKKVAPTILGGMIGGPIGAVVAGGAGGGGGGGTPGVPMRIPGTIGGAVTFPGGTGIQMGWQPGQRIPGIKGGGTGGGPPGRMAASLGPMGQCPSGYHYAKDGSGRMVRNRRMNIANPRALRRAMRRVQGFEKMAKRTIQFTRRVKMKKRSSS